jgi:pyruvate dehydrogenase E2 component (dihydrolipoamide acetyltransferase)
VTDDDAVAGLSLLGGAGYGSAPTGRKSMPAIQPITMPKWGLAMEEGQLARWAVEEGAEIAAGQEIMDIETTKIANVFESPVAGVLRRKVVADGETVPVGALLGVVAEAGVPEAEVDAFVGKFLESFKPAEKGDAGPTAETFEVGGKKLRHLRLGPESGTPLLLLHGFGADMASWMFNQAALAEDRPVHALDLPGHGGSAKDVGEGSVQALAATVLAYMDAAAISRAHLVGHSLGAAIALEIANVSPDRVAALTLIAPAGFGAEVSGEFIQGFQAESRSKKLRPVIEMLVADPGLISADMVEDVLKFKRLDGAQAALKTIAEANFSGSTQRIDLRDRLAGLKIPVQVVWGEADRILPAKHAENLPPNVKVTRIAGAGHIPHMEKANEVNALIKALG